MAVTLILQRSISQSTDHTKILYRDFVKEQAEKMAARVARIYGGSSVINVYDFDETIISSSVLHIKDFGKKHL